MNKEGARTVIEKESSNGIFTEPLSKIHNDLSSGLLCAHTRINDNTKKTLEAEMDATDQQERKKQFMEGYSP